jgi:hypothetical protein
MTDRQKTAFLGCVQYIRHFFLRHLCVLLRIFRSGQFIIDGSGVVHCVLFHAQFITSFYMITLFSYSIYPFAKYKTGCSRRKESNFLLPEMKPRVFGLPVPRLVTASTLLTTLSHQNVRCYR